MGKICVMYLMLIRKDVRLKNNKLIFKKLYWYISNSYFICNCIIFFKINSMEVIL